MPARFSTPPIPRLRGFSLGLVYLTLSFPLGSWVGRIPQIKESLDASDASWGVANTVATSGEIVGLGIIVVLIGRASTRTMTIVTAWIVLAMGPLVALSPTLLQPRSLAYAYRRRGLVDVHATVDELIDDPCIRRKRHVSSITPADRW